MPLFHRCEICCEIPKMERLIQRFAAAAKEARTPSPVVLGKPTVPESEIERSTRQIEALRDHPAYHEGMSAAAAERLLREQESKAWLLRSSLSTANQVVVSYSSTKGGKNTFTHQIVGTEIAYDDLDKRMLSRTEFMLRS